VHKQSPLVAEFAAERVFLSHPKLRGT